jgi:hypothetical protein
MISRARACAYAQGGVRSESGSRSSLYTAEAIAAVLAEAKETRVGAARAEEIAMSLRREPEASTPGHRPDAEPETNPSPLQPPRRHEMPPSAKNSRLRSRKWSSLPRSRARSLLM